MIPYGTDRSLLALSSASQRLDGLAGVVIKAPLLPTANPDMCWIHSYQKHQFQHPDSIRRSSVCLRPISVWVQALQVEQAAGAYPSAAVGAIGV